MTIGERNPSMKARRLPKCGARSRDKHDGAPHFGGPIKWEVIAGDCLDVMARIEPGSVNLGVVDPPYNQGVDYGEHHNDRMTPPEYRSWSLQWMRPAARLLAPDGTLFLLNRWEWVFESERLLRAAGLHIHQPIPWHESFGQNCPGKYNRTSRLLIWCTKHAKRFTFNRGGVNRASARQDEYLDTRANPNGKNWDDVWGIEPPIPRLTGTCKERIKDEHGKSVFPTQLPLDLLRPIVSAHSNPGDLVLDPFSGSGTTGAVCIELGRRYIGIEKSEDFAERSRQRLEERATAGIVQSPRPKLVTRHTSAAKRRRVIAVLKHPEKSRWSLRRIAAACRCTHTTVRRIRRELELEQYSISR
jgi:site-specific DNA-methyltransferase (adenine-specific)